MYLYIVRHGEAFAKEVNPVRPLNELGYQQALKVGQFLKKNGLPVKNIYHSSIERAKQTAEIIGKELPYVQTVEFLSAIDPAEDMNKLLQVVDYFSEDTLLVGHIPQVELLANYLLSGNYNRPVAAFDTAAIMCFKKETSFWVLSWFVNPALL